MISTADRIDLAAGVSLSNGRLGDVVRGSSWPLNDSGTFVLGRVGRPLDLVVQELAEAFDLPLDVARFDVLQFVWTLNMLALVNVVQNGSRLRRLADWLLLLARLAPAGALPTPLTRRRALDTGSARRAVSSCLSASSSRAVAISTAATVALLPLAGLGSGSGRPAVLVVALGIGTGVGVGLHEAGHVAFLRGVPSALVVRGHRTFVLHAPLAPVRRSIVAISGPVVAVGVGLALVVLGAAASEFAVVALGLPLAAHALSLTVLAGDGRTACGI